MTGRAPRVCAVSFKPCWRDEHGRWMSSGGFPLQMTAIASLFDTMDLLVVETGAQAGGLPLPAQARVVPLRAPTGEDARRKLSVVAHLPAYLGVMTACIREADVVHVPLPGDLPLLAFVTALALRKPVIARYGGSWPTNSETTVIGRITKDLMRRVAGGRNVMLATGDGSAPPAPGMSWIFSTSLSRAELDAIDTDVDRGLSSPPRLVYIGRLSAEKGVALLLEAVAALDRRPGMPRLCVTIIGDGSERAALEARTRHLGIADRVAFAGQLARAALGDRLADADLCVQPSLTEGFSKAWLDAMAHGLPVLATDVGAARAVIGADDERGWVVRPGDAGALADAIARAVTTPRDWPALRRRCRSYVESRTLEAWAHHIGERCAAQWGWSIDDGRLRA